MSETNELILKKLESIGNEQLSHFIYFFIMRLENNLFGEGKENALPSWTTEKGSTVQLYNKRINCSGRWANTFQSV